MMWLLRLSAAVVAVATASQVIHGQQSVRDIPDEVSCHNCTVSVARLRILHLPYDTTDGSPAGVRVDPHGRYWVFRRDDVPLVFDSLGKLITAIGTRGLGPGRFVGAYAAFFIQGDSTLILDSRAGRATMLDPNLRPVRFIDVSVPMHSPILRVWPTSVVGSGSLPSAEHAGQPLHEVSLDGPAARHLRSFGPGDGSLRPAEILSMWHKLGNATGSGFWSAAVNQYEFYQWRHDGTLAGTFRRSPRWFSDVSTLTYDWRSDPPLPFVAGISEDSHRTLRLLIHVAGSDWRDAYIEVPKDAVELPERQMRLSKLRGSYIEFIDPSISRVVTRLHLDAYVLALLPNNQIAIYEEDEVPRRFRVVIATTTIAHR